MKFINKLGQWAIRLLTEMGGIGALFGKAAFLAVRPPYRIRNTIKQMESLGVGSIPVVLITATFTGMVLALQSYHGFKRFNAEDFIGSVVSLSMTRELGPVLTALIVAGRAGAAMAAELGTMKVTEQVDALATLAVHPVQYLVSPRFVAGIVMLPVLTILADLIGIVGGYVVSVNILGANAGVYIQRSTQYLELEDIMGGLIKAAVFGAIIACVSCYKGFQADGGAEGVGRATTGAVVVSEMLILISNYYVTVFLR